MQNNIPGRRVNILLLGRDDNPLNGHVRSYYQALPKDKFDKRMVVAMSIGKKKDYAFHVQPVSIWAKIRSIKPTHLKNIIKYRFFVQKNKERPEYCFLGCDEKCDVTAQEILEKNPGFVPDVIALYWTGAFLSSKVIRDLHNLTGARMFFSFVDEAYLTGGCHYPNECKGYLSGCHDCPALSKGKNIAEIQMADKLRYWKDMPKIISGVPSDCQMALSSPLFKDAYPIPIISVPDVTLTDCHSARQKWNISDEEFVILLGANYINDKRKGFVFAIEAINRIAKKKNSICLFLLGHKENTTIKNLNINSNVKIISPGYLSLDDLFIAYCASNCHISPSVADSGPMLVNYSIACGTPVISFNIGVARDIVLHKETGYIAQYKDSMDIAKGIDWLYNLNQEERQRIRNRCLLLMNELKQQKPYYDVIYDIIINTRCSMKF